MTNKRPIRYRAELPDGTRETIHLPQHSSYLYDQSDAINSQFEGTIFYTVVKDTGQQDSHGCAIYDLADVVAYDDEAVECFEASSEENINARALMPFAATLWDNVLSKADHGYLKLSEIKEGNHPSLKVLGASWVIFTQDPLSQDDPMLWAQIIPGDNELFIAGPIMSGEVDFSSVHHQYFVTNYSNPQATSCNFYGLFIDYDEFMDVQTAIDESHQEIGAMLGLKPIKDTGALPMWTLQPKELGLNSAGITLRDNTGHMHHLNGHPSIEKGIVSLTLFGMVKPKQADMRIVFLNKHVHSAGLTRIGAEKAAQILSPFLRDTTAALIANGTWPQRERPQPTASQKLARGFRKLFNLGD